jgi:hypothetical protein
MGNSNSGRPKMFKGKTRSVHVIFQASQIKKLGGIAKKSDCSLSELIRLAVDRLIASGV